MSQSRSPGNLPAAAPGSRQTSHFQRRVMAMLCQIPFGSVTTYGDIARAIGSPGHARQVGWTLGNFPDGIELPCHRVVNSEGKLSGGWSFGHPEIMRQRLLEEGVPFQREYQVDLEMCRWDLEAMLSAADKMDDFENIPA